MTTQNRKKLKSVLSGILFLIFMLALTIVALETFSHYKGSKTINLHAPVITRKVLTIHAPVNVVWKVFSDVNNWGTWQKEITDPRMNEPFQAGSTFNWKSNGLTIHSTLQTVEVNKAVSWYGPAFGSFAIHTWHFSEQGGQTIVSVEESMEGWLVGLFKDRFQSALDTSIDNWLTYLKVTSEKG